MIDHYKVLQISETATKLEIKKAFKKLAMKYHPDKGGDTKLFQQINESYQFLMDEHKRQQYDMNNSKSTNNSTMYDGFGNKISIDIEIVLTFTLEQIYRGWSCKNFEYQTNIGKDFVDIELSYTIMSGTTIKYIGKGHNNNGNRGNLYIKILINDPKFKKKNLKDVVTIIEVDYIRATVGGKLLIDNFIRKETVSFNISANIKEGSIIRSNERLGMGIEERGYVFGIVKLVYPTLNKVTKESLKLISEYIETQEYNTYFKFK